VSEVDRAVENLTDNLIPVVKKRILPAMEISSEDVEFEIMIPASLFIVRDGLKGLKAKS
jgi:hypothetical protein